ncbi:MAG TPA: chorismate synthase [Candidatus Bathyarchaeia archaeon]|nr:chorismate synthase [Candidatus Bathyarchaeia archaeon]
MWSNTFGKAFAVTCFGESHGPGVGATVDGCPAGLPLTVEDVQQALDLRMPLEKEVVSTRREPDTVEIFSGLFQNHTTGAPITLHIRNKDAKSSDYDQLKDVVRPGHADYPAKVKYGGFSDYRGGGRLSGRMTATFVAVGAIGRKVLSQFGVEVLAYTRAIGDVRLETSPNPDDARKVTYENSMRCPDSVAAEKMREVVLSARADGDSVGGVVECTALNLPVGVGEPLFDALDSELAKILFGIPAVKGVEFGAGFQSSRLRGSENNDQYVVKEGKVVTLTNNSGGVLGGMSTGMPLLLRVAFKPPSSIARSQRTVNMSRMEEASLAVKGRHDPCVVPKAVPVVQAMVSLGLVDLMIRGGMIPRVLKS